MNGHRNAVVGDLATIVGGGTPSRGNAQFYGGLIPWVTPKDMKSWEIYGSQINITQDGLDNSASRLVPANSILIVVRSGVLKHTIPVGINRRPVAINQDMKALQCSNEVDVNFLGRFIKAQSPVILQWVRSTTADNFPIDKLKALPVLLPPLSEQRRIAEMLDRAEALRAKRGNALALLDTLTQSIFLDMFGATESSGWPVATIADMALPTVGSIRTGPFGSQLLHSEFVDEGVAVLGIDNAVANEFRWSDRSSCQ